MPLLIYLSRICISKDTGAKGEKMKKGWEGDVDKLLKRIDELEARVIVLESIETSVLIHAVGGKGDSINCGFSPPLQVPYHRVSLKDAVTMIVDHLRLEWKPGVVHEESESLVKKRSVAKKGSK